MGHTRRCTTFALIVALASLCSGRVQGEETWRLRRIDNSGFPEDVRGTRASRMEPHEGWLYLATWSITHGGKLYRSTDGENWEAISPGGFGNVNNFCVISFKWFKGKLYAATWNMKDGFSMCRGNADAEDCADVVWEPITTDGFGDSGNKAGTSMWFFKGFLYVGCFNPISGPEVWRSASGNPGTWTQVNQDGWGEPSNSDATMMTAHDGYLYVGTESERRPRAGCQLWRTDGNLSPPYDQWEQVNTTGFGSRLNHNISGLGVFKGKIYAATWNALSFFGSRKLEGESLGVEVWRATPSATVPFPDWERVNTKGFGDPKMVTTTPIVVHEDTLYLGTNSTADDGGVLMKTNDGTAWERIDAPGFLEPPSQGPSWALEVFNGRLFIGDSSEKKTFDLWVYEPSPR